MSIPADTPAAVTTSPVSTKRASRSTSMPSPASASRSIEPSASSPCARRAAALAKTKAAGAHACHHCSALREGADATHEGSRWRRAAASCRREERRGLRCRAPPSAYIYNKMTVCVTTARDPWCRPRAHCDWDSSLPSRPGREHFVGAGEVELLDAVPEIAAATLKSSMESACRRAPRTPGRLSLVFGHAGWRACQCDIVPSGLPTFSSPTCPRSTCAKACETKG